jgi:uncharacterized membrane protein YidH (DUF202 family)
MTVGPDPERYPGASRRTRVARERTLLAGWRTDVALGAVALAIGGLVPKVSHAPDERFIAFRIGCGLLALIFAIGGSVRDRGVVTAITVNLTVLIVLSVAALLARVDIRHREHDESLSSSW